MITLATFTRNEENCVGHMIESVYDFVSEIVVVDTGSYDNTVDICRKYHARVYEVGFTDFAKIRTLASHLSREPWVLMLDADEALEGADRLVGLAENGEVDAYAFPRKRWLDLGMKEQTELEAYPDFQVRFYRNSTNYIWERELHEYFHGAAVHNLLHGPIIHHFHDVFKDEERLIERKLLYNKLAPMAKVSIEGGKSTDN